jgi:hypothetical protein
MKAIANIGFSTLLCVCLAPSCTKNTTARKKEELVSGSCRIKQLIMKAQGHKDKSGIFTYNSNGDPVNYTPAGYGNNSLKYEFRYDKIGRLTDYIGYNETWTPIVCNFWAKYFHDNRNRIVRDSVYYNSNYGAPLASHAQHIGVTVYEYDSKDRISSISYKQFHNGVPNGIVSYYRFDYNEAGNLIWPGAKYDDKISIYRTSKVWMFLCRNYSMNNLKPAVSYQPNGLPASFGATAARGASMHFLETIDLSDCEVIYECTK